MFTTAFFKLLTVLSYLVWVLFPLVIIVAWVELLPATILAAGEAMLKSHKDLKDQILLWYLKNY